MLSKLLLVGVVCTAFAPSLHADSKHDRGHHDGDHHSHGNDRHNYSYHRYYSRPYSRGYYGYGYGYPYYYSRPRTTIAIGVGSGYYGTEYASSYSRDNDRPIYRGQQVSEGNDGSLEISVQKKLSRLGYYSGTIDGDIGPATRRAISRYQRDNDLAETGRIDRSLVSALGVS